MSFDTTLIGGGALSGGMPHYKYIANRLLTLFQNLCSGAKLSEYHTGYLAFLANLLRTLPLERNSDDFVFENQMLAQIIRQGHVIGDISCPTHYFPEASSMNLQRSIVYGLGVVRVSLQTLASRLGLSHCSYLSA